MRLRRMLSAIRARVPRYVLSGEALLGTNGWGVGIVLGQPPLHLAQVLPGVLERAAEGAPLRGLGGELAFWDAADEVFEPLAEPLQAATVGTFVFFRDRFEVGREARRRIALADPRAFGHVRRDRCGEGRVRVNVFAAS